MKQKTHTYTDGNGKLRTYTTQEYVPDTWEMDVRASNGRIETWETTDKVSMLCRIKSLLLKPKNGIDRY
jgi:hypothetical protein